jgi:hypothetical protein
MSEAEQESALARQMLAAVEQMDKQFEEQEPDLGPVPDELKVAAKHLQGLKERMLADLKRLAGATPVDARPETDVTSRFAALIDEFTGIVAGVSDEQAAQGAVEKMQARADEYRSLFTQFANQSGLANKLRLRPAEQRLQEAVQRVQLHSPPAHAMLERFLNQLLLSALKPSDPDSDEAKLLERWEAVSRQLVETLRTIHDEAAACDVRPQLEEQTEEYEACYRQFIDRIDEMDTMQAGIVMQGRAASRSALHQELHRIRHQVPAAYKHLRDLAKRLRETGL